MSKGNRRLSYCLFTSIGSSNSACGDNDAHIKKIIDWIRGGASSTEGNLETLEALAGRGRRGFCRISVSYFGILVRIFKHRVRTVFSFPNACREVDVTRQQTKTNFQTWLWPLSAFKSDPRPFVADLYPLETFLWKRNSNPCSEGFKISVEEIGIQISWKSSLLLPSTAKPF